MLKVRILKKADIWTPILIYKKKAIKIISLKENKLIVKHKITQKGFIPIDRILTERFIKSVILDLTQGRIN